MNPINRREFLKISALGATTLFVSTALSGYGEDKKTNYIPIRFDHGVASGDPLSDKVIL